MSKERNYITLLIATLTLILSETRAQSVSPMGADKAIISFLHPEAVAPPVSDSTRKPFIVSAIYISGNRKTKDYIIKRELPFQEGDSVRLNELVEKFRVGKQQLVNTRLFNDVIISLKSFRGYFVEVQIDVKERWYIFPIPYFKPVDRNLQTWADKGYSLNRINYGAKFTYYNTTGRNDRLRLWLITGYSRQIQASYDQPFADKSLKYGYGVNFLYAGQKEVNPITVDNKQFFIKADSLPKAGKFLEEVLGGAISLSYRPHLRTRHSLRLGFVSDKIDSAVLQVNPEYLTTTGKTKTWYPELSYTVNYVNTDYAPYPLRGRMGELSLSRIGFGQDLGVWSLNFRGTQAWELKWKSSYTLQVGGTVRLPFDQPYTQHKMLGYGDFYLRGLEKYVVDGVAGMLVRNTVRRELFNFYMRLPVKSKSHDRIPFRIFAKTYADMGYSYNKNYPDNSLVNRMLYTTGAGVDVVTLYDVVMRFEYSFNQMGESGFFFHFKNDF
ncbi:POTRA domain-containing protein [Flavihumibacter petaseus]|uniref:POTRA domain-containing protein n=1 Tax=Flavihumibacter petaseus NBRC 106054 TaxID=1220578 RepID=A0A0E9MZ70_9BACT|nr:BamA/TamA family outer membrane protein [Flavihumibacter petaseus]GAO42843.1 hypothetical protein FPE01S_01_18610 [Flavihumibacter petaseus NBRC 106054]